MKKVGLLLLALSYTIFIEARTVNRYEGSRIFWDARNPVVIFNGGGYARLIELQDGRLLACCENSGIRIATSNNKGRTWSTARTIAPNPDKWPNCVPDLIQLSDGTIIVTYNPRPSSPYSPDRHFSIRLRRSTDNGSTWSDEIVVYDAGYQWDVGCWEPSMLELPSGELQLYLADESPYTGNNGDQQISLCRSFDGGLTWTTPQRVSYRQGYRDGMPVPILLKDNSYIVVAIEDNGWSGIGDFIPTTIRMPLDTNWGRNIYIPANNSRRQKAVDYNYCPIAKGGAPYLRMLPNGETILSHQSPYGEGDNKKMYCYVGDVYARNFKAMSCPFLIKGNRDALWNSLAVIDTGIVVAVAGISGSITMMKGYPRHQLEAKYSTPKIDGIGLSSDGYYSSTLNQIMMGNETGTFTYADLAYDNDSLYIFCQVYDQKIVEEGDYVVINVDAAASSTNVPMSTSYKWIVNPLGAIQAFQGDETKWIPNILDASHIEARKLTNQYRFEMAIPWTGIGLKKRAEEYALSMNLQIHNSDGVASTTEIIPDSKDDGPYTWMLLHLVPNPEETAIQEIHIPRKHTEVSPILFDLQGHRISRPSRGIYIQEGRKKLYK